MAFTTFPSVGPYAPEALTADLNTNFGKTVEVALAGVADGEFLVYDGSSSVWINRTSAEAGIPAAVADLTDVTIATVANGEFMIYDGSSASWINATAAEAGVPANLEDLTNVSIATPADGEVLTYDGSSGSWINAAAGGGTTTVASLPAGTAGQTSFVTDATATTFASIVAGGGANGVPVYSDGTNWRIG